MQFVQYRAPSVTISMAITLHLVWATLLLIDPAAVNATSVNAIFKFIHSPTELAFALYSVAILASFGLFTKIPWIVLLLLPQQIALMMSAAGAIDAMWLAQFADGVSRPRTFLIADQLYSVLLAMGHTFAASVHVNRLIRRRNGSKGV